jgi:hypothetical protein
MFSSQDLEIFKQVGQIFFDTWWIVLPITFYYLFHLLWVEYTGWYAADGWNPSKKWTLLEVIPPREIEKGPKMMESFFSGLAGVLSTYNTFDEYIKGAWFHDRFSLEIVGEEGKVHFYIRAETKHRNMVEAHIYAQYPDAEILEVEDYTKKFPKIVPNRDWDMWGTDFQFVAPNAYPLKTYDKFEESVTGEMNDPIAAFAEVMGTLGPGQHIWIQYMIQPLQESWKLGKEQQEVLNKITGRGADPEPGFINHLVDVFTHIPTALFKPPEFPTAAKKEQQPLEFRLTPIEKEVLKSVEEKLGKNMFRTKMRMIAIARRENFDRAKVSAITGAFKQVNDMNANQVKPEDVSKTYGKIFFIKRTANFRKRKIYDRYRKRKPDGPLIYLSTKELATLFHFPDMGVKSPSIPRTSAKLGAAPHNLPVE